MSKNSAKSNYENLTSWIVHNKIKRKEKIEEIQEDSIIVKPKS